MSIKTWEEREREAHGHLTLSPLTTGIYMKQEIAELRAALVSLESIANSDDCPGGESMRLVLENRGMKTELQSLRKQESVGVAVRNYGIGGGTFVKFIRELDIGERVYLAAGAKPAIAITKEQVRSAGGIVHSNGNVFFTNLEQLNALLNT